ncbi:MAG: ATP-binding protein [Candidatus Methanosuratincola sp.]
MKECVLMQSDRLIYPLAASAAFALSAAWLAIFPIGAQINYSNLLMEGVILAVLLVGSLFLHNMGAYLKSGLAALSMGFLVGLLGEVTAEPEIVGAFLGGLLKAGGFVSTIYGLAALRGKISEASLERMPLGSPKSSDSILAEVPEAENSSLEEVKRLAAIGKVAAMVGHDMRNPLQAIVYAVYNTEEEIKGLPESAKKMLEERGFIDFLEMLKRQVNFMSKMAADLQDYAKPTKPAFHAVDLREIVEEALKSVSRPEGISVVVNSDPALGMIKGDPQLIRRVFANIISNAYQAMPGDGSLEISMVREGNCAKVSFSDTGVGISPENLKKLFDPFFTTKAKGMGLGLAICKKMIEAHRGSIEVESEPGKGTRFTIRLPIG